MDGQQPTQLIPTFKIRYAKDTDLLAITDFIIDVCKMIGRPYDTDSLYDIIFLGIDQGIGLVAETDGKLVGCLAAMIYPSVFKNDDLEAMELFWYVLPEYRKYKVGTELVNVLESVCKERKITKLFMAAPHHTKGVPFERYYQRAGYKKTETIYTKEF